MVMSDNDFEPKGKNKNKDKIEAQHDTMDDFGYWIKAAVTSHLAS